VSLFQSSLLKLILALVCSQVLCASQLSIFNNDDDHYLLDNPSQNEISLVFHDIRIGVDVTEALLETDSTSGKLVHMWFSKQRLKKYFPHLLQKIRFEKIDHLLTSANTHLVDMDEYYILEDDKPSKLYFLGTAQVVDCVAIAFSSLDSKTIALGHFSPRNDQIISSITDIVSHFITNNKASEPNRIKATLVSSFVTPHLISVITELQNMGVKLKVEVKYSIYRDINSNPPIYIVDPSLIKYSEFIPYVAGYQYRSLVISKDGKTGDIFPETVLHSLVSKRSQEDL
jgi:hypothetical protein